MEYRGGVGECPYAGVPPLPPVPHPSEKRYSLLPMHFGRVVDCIDVCTEGDAIAMIAALDRTPIKFDEFMDWRPENSENRYELRRGAILEIPKPRGKHSEIAGFAIKKLNNIIEQMHFSYFIPRECIVQISNDTGYEPDVAVVNRSLSPSPFVL
jgi:hypothetical protein